MALLEVDELQATRDPRHAAAPAGRPRAAEDHRRVRRPADAGSPTTTTSSPNEPRQRSIVSDELAEITAKYGDERRSVIVPWDGEVTDEDLIAEEDVVVTITRGGYAKRTRTDNYRAQRRGGKGVRGAQLRGDDVVEHFFVTTTHHCLLFFTNKGRVYRAKAYELPDTGRDARGQHVANLLAFQPEEQIAQVLDIRDYDAAPYLVLATRDGHGEEDPPRRVRLQPQRRRHRDQPARTTTSSSPRSSSTRAPTSCSSRARACRSGSRADDETLRPMGRATSGVIGMRFRDGRRAARDGHRDAGVLRRDRHRRRLRQAHAGRRSGRPRAVASTACAR